MTIKTMAEYAMEGKMPEVLFYVGCAGSFDDRAKKITKAFCKILNHIGVEFAVLGKEESCTGDPAKRVGISNNGDAEYRDIQCLRNYENRYYMPTLF